MLRSIPLAEVSAHVGKELGVSNWTEITQERINAFAEATGDHHWMHVDIERATRERGGTIAHGLLIACLVPTLQGQFMEITDFAGGYSYGFDKLRFTQPVRAGQRVRLRQLLHSVGPKNAGTLVTIKCEMEIGDEARPALVADYLAFYRGA